MNSGTYYLVIDGEDGSCGPYQLEGEIIPTITGVVEEEDVTTLSLAVNPNPAGSTISFFSTFPIVYNDTPIIEIFNVAGKRIMRMQGPRDCSAFSYTWDKRDMHGSPVASGIYFVRLRVGREEAVRKLVILR